MNTGLKAYPGWYFHSNKFLFRISILFFVCTSWHGLPPFRAITKREYLLTRVLDFVSVLLVTFQPMFSMSFLGLLACRKADQVRSNHAAIERLTTRVLFLALFAEL